MKIWHGYGSEHSMNLVMIGHFKSSEDAENTQKLIEQLTEGLRDKTDIDSSCDRYDDDVMDLLRKANCYILGPADLEIFAYDFHAQVKGDKITLTTNESEVSTFFKLMINKGAKVEIYSANDYPDTESGGK